MAKCLEEGCTKSSGYNYKNESGYRYCKLHAKTRLVDNKIQRMSNKSKNICTNNLCSKDLSKFSNTLCTFHYKLQLTKLENLIKINNIKDFNDLKKQYEGRLKQFKNLQIVDNIDNFTASNIKKYALKGIKDIEFEEQLEEYKNCKVEEFKYLNSIDINNINTLKTQWILEYEELTKYSKIEIKVKPTDEKVKKDKKDNNPKCIIENCKVSANYNKKGLKAIYCSTHAKDIGIGNKDGELRNVRTKLCEHIFEDGLDCIKIALYGIDKKQFCLSHIEEGMYKLSKDKECKEDECKITPSYGFENSIAEYCKLHKKDNMVQLFQKCITDNCKERARYNLDGEKGSRYCSLHKTIDMKDNTKRICIEDNCTEEAYYNVKYNHNGIYCSLHKKDNMCSNKNKICKYGDCLINAYFGTKDNPKQYCVTHKYEKIHFNYTSKTCMACNLYEVKREPFLCSYCNPDRHSKTKEIEVVKFLRENNIQFIHNKSTGYKYGRYYPDILINCDTHFIVVEVDEGQHKQYDKECEYIRMNNVYLAKGLPVVFIRFNPDDFKVNNTRNKTVLKTKLKKLLKVIEEYKDKENINFIELIYMYFDCNCMNKCKFIHTKEFDLSYI